ncbi:MAG: hypothetical protein LUC98_01810 [Lachnospiraceae bacterium]|nr:hypothetical protein [Lachnospiraceae bacterium]
MVSVTTEALQQVRIALCDFKTDMVGTSGRSRGRADEIRMHNSAVIDGAVRDVQESETRINQLEESVHRLEDRLVQIRSETEQLESSIYNMESRMYAVRDQMNAIMGQDLERESDAAASLLSDLEYEYNCLYESVRDAKYRVSELAREQQQCKSELSRTESELASEKRRHSNLLNKLERLRNAHRRVEDDLNRYVSAVRFFEIRSDMAAQSNVSALDICISSIDSYLSVIL